MLSRTTCRYQLFNICGQGQHRYLTDWEPNTRYTSLHDLSLCLQFGKQSDGLTPDRSADTYQYKVVAYLPILVTRTCQAYFARYQWMFRIYCCSTNLKTSLQGSHWS